MTCPFRSLRWTPAFAGVTELWVRASRKSGTESERASGYAATFIAAFSRA